MVRWQLDVRSPCTASVLTGSTECCRQMETLPRPLVSAEVIRMSAHGRDCPESPRIPPTQLGLHIVVHGNDMYIILNNLLITIDLSMFNYCLHKLTLQTSCTSLRTGS